MSEMQVVDQSLNEEKLSSQNQDIDAKEESLNELIKENLRLSRETAYMVKQINTYVAWQRIFGWLKVLFIIIPLIIGFIYLPPLLKDAYKQFISMMGANIQ